MNPVLKLVAAEPVVVNNVPELELTKRQEVPIDEELDPSMRELRLLRIPPVELMIVVDTDNSVDGELAPYVGAPGFVSPIAMDVAADVSGDFTGAVSADE